MISRLYVLVRKDLRCSSPSVQAGHVVAEYCLTNNSATRWKNQTLIYLEVDNLKKLKWWCSKLERKNIEFVKFTEPDLSDELTAICIYLNYPSTIFNRLNLLV